MLRSLITTEDKAMLPIAHPGRLLKRELEARSMSANRLAWPSAFPPAASPTFLNGRRSITAETAVRLGRYFGNRPRFWLALQSQYDIALVERDRGAEIARQVRPSASDLAGGFDTEKEPGWNEVESRGGRG